MSGNTLKLELYTPVRGRRPDQYDLATAECEHQIDSMFAEASQNLSINMSPLNREIEPPDEQFGMLQATAMQEE